MKPIITYDVNKLEKLLGIQIPPAARQSLGEFLETYRTRYQKPRLQHREDRELYFRNDDDVELMHLSQWDGVDKLPATLELEARRWLIESLIDMLRECGMNAPGSHYYNGMTEEHVGPVLPFLVEVFQRLDGTKAASRATLFHDLIAIYTGEERPH